MNIKRFKRKKHTETEAPEVLRYPDTRPAETGQQPDVEMSENRRRPDMETAGSGQQPDIEADESRRQSDIEAAETGRHSEDEMTEALHHPGIKTQKRFPVRPETGHSSAEVEAYTRIGWTNQSVDSPSKSIGEIVKSNVFTYFNLIFAVIAVMLILVGSFRDLTFLPIIIANTLIGIVQELRAKKTLDDLKVLNAPKAHVLRDGAEAVIPAEQLVLDDVTFFSAGNQICADAVVLTGSVSVNESLLTGESDEIIKKPGDKLMSGSFVVSGTCKSRLDKVGADSYISKLTTEAKLMDSSEQSEMMRSLNRLVKFVGIIIIPLGILLFVQQFFLAGQPARDSVTSMVAAILGMIPEGLYLLASVALVVSVVRLSMSKVLVHDMKCIETLARVDTLLLDKTGTITDNTMRVAKLLPAAGYDADTQPPLETLISNFAGAMSRDNITMEAIQAYFHEPSDVHPVSVTGFSSAYKYSSVSFADATYVLGAPEMVLRGDYETYRADIESQSRLGYRVLVFASYPVPAAGEALDKSATPLALILLSNPIREEAPETFRYFEEQGVDIKVISGDNPATVSEVAKQAGIAGAGRYVDATSLKSSEEIADALKNYSVFGRVTPKQKRMFVNELKGAGHTVAMTGDGVNDVLALKDADCSVAMASGSDAACQVSQLVLMDSDFSRMPSVVMEGRRVVNNVQRSASLFLVKNIFSLLMALISLLFMMSYPIEPSQLSLVSMFTIGVPGFFLALQPNKNIITGHFITNVLLKALPAGLTNVILVGIFVWFGNVFGLSSVEMSTAATLLLAIVGFMLLFKICQPMNALRVAIWIGCMTAFLVAAGLLGDLFAITSMSAKCIMLFLVFAALAEPFLRYNTLFVDKIHTFFSFLLDKIKELFHRH